MELLDGWCRVGYQGQLLPLPAELLHRAEEVEQRVEREKQRANAAEREELLQAKSKKIRNQARRRAIATFIASRASPAAVPAPRQHAANRDVPRAKTHR